MLLYNLEIRNYRCLEHVTLDHLQKFNVLIGRNNAGKSSVFLALYDLFRTLTGVTNISADVLTDRDLRHSLEMNLTFKPQQQEREEFFDLLINTGFDVQRRSTLLASPFLRMINMVVPKVKTVLGQK